MKVCPKCGFEESPFWRPAFVDIEKEIIEVENLAMIEPGLLAKLKPGQDVIIGRNAYRLTRKGTRGKPKWVQRMYLPLYIANSSSFRKVKKYDGGKPRHRLVASLSKAGMI